MSLVHLVAVKMTGYDHYTLFFDNRDEKDAKTENPFVGFENYFVPKLNYHSKHPEDGFHQHYYGYFNFPIFTAEEIYDLYKKRCESQKR